MILVFDVNETLLDLSALDSVFARRLGDATSRRAWFTQLLQSAMAATLSNDYRDFLTLARAALEMVAARVPTELTREAADEILEAFHHAPAHSDVPLGLERLAAARIRIAALTNNPDRLVRAQLTNAHLLDYFERVLSVDAVRQYKPAPAAYRYAAMELSVPIGDAWLVAAHTWDVAGAMRVGMRGILVKRPGVVPDPMAPQADVEGSDLLAIADAAGAMQERQAT